MAAIVNPDLGSDFHCVDDLDPGLSLVAGRDCLAESIARGLSTETGKLWYDPHWGYDLTRLVGSSKPTAIIQSGIRRHCERDERVLGVRPIVQMVAQTVSVGIEITDSQGTFSRTVLVGAATVELLAS